MAFGQKVEAKDILGMETEEFQSRLSKIDAFETRLAELNTARQADTERIMAQFETLKPKPAAEPVADPDISFLENPSRSIDDRLRPLQQATLDNAIMLMHRQARESYPRDFERWGNEIVKVMQDTAGDNQANAKAWELAVMIVRGRHAADLEKDGATGKYTFLEPVSAGLQSEKPQDGLNADQRKMVSKLKNLGPKGMTAEKYQNGMKRLEESRNDRMGSFARAK